MKKVLVLFAASFFLVSANFAQTGTRRADTTVTPNKSMKKNMRKGKRNMDSTINGNGSLYPMNNGTGRADSTNSGNGTIMPNQTPGQMPTPVSPSPVPVPTPVPNQKPSK